MGDDLEPAEEGRAPLLTTDEVADLLDAVARGQGLYTAARRLNLPRDTVHLYAENVQEFADMVAAAEAEALEEVVRALRAEALDGSVAAAKELLRHAESKTKAGPGRPKKQTDPSMAIDVESIVRKQRELKTGVSEFGEEGLIG